MRSILISTTASFFDTVKATDLKDILAGKGIEPILHYQFTEPFPFDPAEVFGIVAGHAPTGQMVRIGAAEAKLFPNLKIVTPFGVGMNHIDKEGLEKAGVAVKTLPHFSKRTVAELTLSFIFALARRIVPQTRAIQGGEWRRQDGATIDGKTLGIIGLGNIGKEVAKLAKGVGMQVIANDLVYDDAFMAEWNIERADKETVICSSDFITLHVPLTEETRNFINEKLVKSMKRGAFFVNAARGEVVNESALLGALEAGELAGAALDVFSQEPPFHSDTLLSLIKHPNVIVTPHVGAFTPETRYAIAQYVCREVIPYGPSDVLQKVDSASMVPQR